MIRTLLVPLSLAAFMASNAFAGPVPAPAVPTAGTAVQPVGGCHADIRRHFVPEFNRSLPHFHRRDCRPVRAEAGREERRRPVDCHRDARRHFIPGAGMVLHRHVGPSCDIRIIRRGTTG